MLIFPIGPGWLTEEHSFSPRPLYNQGTALTVVYENPPLTDRFQSAGHKYKKAAGTRANIGAAFHFVSDFMATMQLFT